MAKRRPVDLPDIASLRVGIVGAGRVGAGLGLALRDAGIPVVAVASRTPSAAAALAARLGDAEATGPREAAHASDLVFLTVPDSQINRVAESVAWLPWHMVVHCSGARGLGALQPVRAAGGLRGCLHPLQTFAEREGEPSLFRGAACGVEGDGLLEALLGRLAAAMGATPFSLRGVDRAAYHAAAVFSSNYIVALMAAARRAWEVAGLDPAVAKAALTPLLANAAENAVALDLQRALTGPVARGDAETVAAHIRALAGKPDLRELYVLLARQLLTLELPLSSAQRRALEAALREAGGKP